MSYPDKDPARGRPDAVALLCLFIALGYMALTRGAFVIPRSFAISNGGLWKAIADQISANHFVLPKTFMFNGESLQLVYPPLAGYLTAAAAHITGAPVTMILLWLPMSLTLLALTAFFLFARAYFGDRRADLAVLIFPLTFQSVTTFTVGGGVPRSLGLLFQLLAWWAACRSWKTAKGAVVAGVFLGMAGLSHPSAAFWGVCGVLFFGLLERRFSFAFLLIIGVTSALVTAPWWITMMYWHGPVPFLAAFSTGGEEMFSWEMLGAPDNFLLPGQMLGALALVGICLFVRDGKLAMPALLFAGLAFDHRGLFASNGVSLGVMAAAQGIWGIYSLCCSPAGNDEQARRASRAAGIVFACFIIMHVAVSNISFFMKERVLLQSPSGEDISSYERIAAAFPEAKSFLFLRRQSARYPVEWLSVISRQRFVPLPQGLEWSGGFKDATMAEIELGRCCAAGSWQCVRDAVARFRLSFDHVVIAKDSCALLAAQHEAQVEMDLPGLLIISGIGD